jgi:O-succinylbenzoic acid--CoA ligase
MELSMFSLDLMVDSNRLLLPSFNRDMIDELESKLDALGIKNHYLLSSSGTTGGNWKGYLISKESLLINARAVNEKLELNQNDIWGASLPHYHIGGLSIYFRAMLLNHQPADLRPWNPLELVQKIRDHHISVISLVPTQVYDLVHLDIIAPKEIRHVLVGGDFLGTELARRFRQLGWPMIQTFGMSEVSSQLCTGMDEKGFYAPLPIHEIKTDSSLRLQVKSKSFFSYLVKKNSDWEFIPLENFLDQDGFFTLPDKALIQEEGVKFLGRDDGFVKSSGHLLNIIDLKEALDRFGLEHHCWGSMELQTSNSPRLGQQLTLYYLETVAEHKVQEFLKIIRPIRIHTIKKLKAFERTDLGKFKTGQLNL